MIVPGRCYYLNPSIFSKLQLFKILSSDFFITATFGYQLSAVRKNTGIDFLRAEFL